MSRASKRRARPNRRCQRPEHDPLQAEVRRARRRRRLGPDPRCAACDEARAEVLIQLSEPLAELLRGMGLQAPPHVPVCRGCRAFAHSVLHGLSVVRPLNLLEYVTAWLRGVGAMLPTVGALCVTKADALDRLLGALDVRYPRWRDLGASKAQVFRENSTVRHTAGPAVCILCRMAPQTRVFVNIPPSVVEEHHLAGRKNALYVTVLLCPNCHAELSELNRDAGAIMHWPRDVLHQVAIVLRALGLFFPRLGKAAEKLAADLECLVRALDAQFPAWREMPEAR